MSILQPGIIAVRECGSMPVMIILCMTSVMIGQYALSCFALLTTSVAFHADDARTLFIRGQQQSCTELSISCLLLKPFLIPNL